MMSFTVDQRFIATGTIILRLRGKKTYIKEGKNFGRISVVFILFTENDRW